MILQLQAKVHGLGYLGVSTCTYPIFSEFKATFRIPSVRSLFASLFASLFVSLLAKQGLINFCTVVVYSGIRADYDDKFLYSRSYHCLAGSDYDDKFLYCRR